MANINGNNSANTLNGTAFADRIDGKGGNDVIDAGDGDDFAYGGSGHDVIRGGRGADRIFGEDGSDNLNGGEGDDLLDGGAGVDWANFEGGAAVNADLTLGIATGQGNDTLTRIERLNGSSFGDTLRGNASANTLQGGAGADLLIATAGGDIFNGGADIDTVDFAAFATGVIANLNTGVYSAGSTYGSGQLIAVENLIGSNGNDNMTGDGGANVIRGGLGQDILNGGAGTDTLSYSGVQAHNFINLTAGTVASQWLAQAVGNATISNFENVIGGEYIDTVTGSAGNNVISTGASSDTVYATLGQDVIDGGDGFDAVRFDLSTAGVTANLATGTYTLSPGHGGTMASIEFLGGGAYGDTLTGDANYNRFDGGDGSDVIAGGGGFDQIWGGAGSDRLIADGGDDELSGDYGYLGYGDASADVFEVRTSAGNVTINDFRLGVDKLDLTAFGFDQNGVSTYWSGAVAQDGTSQVLTLTGQGNEVVSIELRGIGEGEALTSTDMINGSSSLILVPTYPMNGGNGVADVFVVNPLNGNQVFAGFENGLDRLDLTFIHQGWDGYLDTAPDGSVRYHFDDGQGASFEVLLPGFNLAQLDASDIII